MALLQKSEEAAMRQGEGRVKRTFLGNAKEAGRRAQDEKRSFFTCTLIMNMLFL